MPFTPLHMGVGLVAKGLAPSRVSIPAFGASQVAIDCEPLYHYLRHEWPLHGPLHTILVGGAVGLAVGAAVWAVSTPLDAQASARGAARSRAGRGARAVSSAACRTPCWTGSSTMTSTRSGRSVASPGCSPPAGIAAVPVALVIAGILGASAVERPPRAGVGWGDVTPVPAHV